MRSCPFADNMRLFGTKPLPHIRAVRCERQDECFLHVIYRFNVMASDQIAKACNRTGAGVPKI